MTRKRIADTLSTGSVCSDMQQQSQTCSRYNADLKPVLY
jgi:hypothetical protein